jgi:hypothetical protein
MRNHLWLTIKLEADVFWDLEEWQPMIKIEIYHQKESKNLEQWWCRTNTEIKDHTRIMISKLIWTTLRINLEQAWCQLQVTFVTWLKAKELPWDSKVEETKCLNSNTSRLLNSHLTMPEIGPKLTQLAVKLIIKVTIWKQLKKSPIIIEI